MQTHTDKHSEAKRHTVTTFHYKYAKKKSFDVAWKCYQASSSVVEQLKTMPNLLH